MSRRSDHAVKDREQHALRDYLLLCILSVAGWSVLSAAAAQHFWDAPAITIIGKLAISGVLLAFNVYFAVIIANYFVKAARSPPEDNSE